MEKIIIEHKNTNMINMESIKYTIQKRTIQYIK